MSSINSQLISLLIEWMNDYYFLVELNCNGIFMSRKTYKSTLGEKFDFWSRLRLPNACVSTVIAKPVKPCFSTNLIILYVYSEFFKK